MNKVYVYIEFIILSVFSLFVISITNAQDTNLKADSLEKLLISAQDTVRYRVLIDLAWEYYALQNFDKSFEYASKVIEATGGEKQEKYSAEAYELSGNISYQRAEYDLALKYLLQALKFYNKPEKTGKIAIISNLLGNTYYLLGDYENAITYYKQALKRSKSAKNEKGVANIMNNLGNILYDWGKYDDALKYYLKAVDISKQIGNHKSAGSMLNNIGLVYYDWGDYIKALKYFKKSLEEKKQIPKVQADKLDKWKGIAATLNNIGLVFKELGKYEKSIRYYQLSILISEQLKADVDIAKNYNNISTVYIEWKKFEKALEYAEKAMLIYEKTGFKLGKAATFYNLGEIFDRQNQFENAFKYFDKALKIYEELNNKLGIAQSLSNLGNISLILNRDYIAVEYCTKALEIFKELENKKGIANISGILGEIYGKKGEYESSLKYFEESNRISEEIKNIIFLEENYLNISKIYERLNKYDKALKYHKLFSNYKDSAFNENVHKQIVEIQTKYETEKNKKELELLNKNKALNEAEIKRARILRNSLIIGSVLLILLVVLILNRYKVKAKANTALAKKNQEILNQNKQIEQQKILLENINSELNLKNTEITDSINYARIIQDMVLPDDNRLKIYFPDSFVLFLPKNIVSGDFYWITTLHVSDGVTGSHEVDSSTMPAVTNKVASQGVTASDTLTNNILVVAVADCTGHGIPGAFMSMIGNTLMNEIVRHKKIFCPSEIIKNMYSGLMELITQRNVLTGSCDIDMDISVCCFEPNEALFQVSCAKHTIFLIEDEQLFSITGEKYFLNFRDLDKLSVSFSNHIFPYHSGNCIYLFTDGYPDQFDNCSKQMFSNERFKCLIFKNNLLPMQKCVNVLVC
ncbi:MAG: tetratricopeptide repeat protein [Bacteroidia bacterium]|nr:tetratricopeptide repeat protein [Bacteroidia bacterium]